MNVTVDQLLARLGAKDVEIMLKDTEVARLRVELELARTGLANAESLAERLKAEFAEALDDKR